MRKAIAAYLPVAQALADDDDAAAKQAASPLIEAVPVDLRPLAEAVAIAADIKARRDAFKPFSDALIAHIRDGGIDAVGNAYIVHCPMAFDNSGGDWLSAKPQVLNPYYGDRMLTCGTVTDTLSFDGENPPPKAPPAKLPPPSSSPKKPAAPTAPADPHAGH